MMNHRFGRNLQQIEDDDELGRALHFPPGWWVLPCVVFAVVLITCAIISVLR